MLKSFSPVKSGESVYSINDFSKGFSAAVSVSVKGALTSGLSFNTVETEFPSIPVKAFKAGGKRYFFCQDKKLYSLDGNKALTISETKFDSPTHVIDFDDGNIGIVDGKNLYVSGKVNAVMICPDSTDISYSDGRMFYLTGNTVRFNFTPSGTLDILRNNADDYIEVDKKFGKIVKVNGGYDEIEILTETHVLRYSIGLFPDSFSLKSITRLEFDAKQNGGCIVDGKIFYLSDGKFIDLANRTEICRIDKSAVLCGIAKSEDGLCILPMQKDGQSFAFIYDTRRGEWFYVLFQGEIYGSILLSDGVVKELGAYNGNAGAIWQSEPFTLGDGSPKTVRKVHIDSEYAVNAELVGESQSAIFTVYPGKDVITGVKSKHFTVKITPAEENFSVKEIKFYFNK